MINIDPIFTHAQNIYNFQQKNIYLTYVQRLHYTNKLHNVKIIQTDTHR